MSRFDKGGPARARRQLAVARLLSSPWATLIATVLSVVATLTLAVGVDKKGNPSLWLGIDSAVAGCCIVYCALGGLSGIALGDLLWDVLTAAVTTVSVILTILRTDISIARCVSGWFRYTAQVCDAPLVRL